MVKRDNLTSEYVRQLLDYNPDSGVFTWKSRRPEHFNDGGHNASHNSSKWNGRYAGRVAGRICKDGYVRMAINNRLYAAHRIAFLIMTGELPEYDVDHINMVRIDNRFCNLRVATRSQNQANHRVHSHNKLGVKGVRYIDKNGLFEARITVNGKMKSLGCFQTAKDASDAYAKAASESFGEFARVA